jgi:DNA-binding IclR family transcriptional regulator
VDPGVAALAVPMLRSDGSVLGAISLVASLQRMALADTGKLTALLLRAAQDITARIPESPSQSLP